MITAKQATLATLAVDTITPDPDQPRKDFDKQALQDLADSLQAQGQIQPIVVRPDPQANTNGPAYLLVAGERRWRAHQLAKLPTILAVVRHDLDDPAKRQAVQLLENMQRQDLTTAEAIAGISALVELPGDDGKPLGVAGVARKLNKSESWVSQRNKAANADGQIRQLVEAGKLTDIDAIATLANLLEEFPKLGQFAIDSANGNRPSRWPSFAPVSLKRDELRSALKGAREDAERKAAEQQAEAERRAALTDAERKAEDKQAAKEKAASNPWQAEEKARKQRAKQIADLRPGIEAKTTELLQAAQQALGEQADVNVRSCYLSEYDTHVPKTPAGHTYTLSIATTVWHARAIKAANALPNDGGWEIGLFKDTAVEQLAAPDGMRVVKLSFHGQLSGNKLAKAIAQLPHISAAQAPSAEQPTTLAHAQGSPCATFQEAAGEFLAACSTTGKGREWPYTDAFEAWLDWCQATGNRACRPDELIDEILRGKGISAKRKTAGRVFTGIGPKA